MPTHDRSLRDEVLEHLRWEVSLGGIGIPRQAPPPQSASAARIDREIRDERRLPVTEARGETAAVADPAPRELAASPTNPLVDAPRARPDPSQVRVRLTQLEEQVRSCTRCELHVRRTQTVFARGNPESRLVFVGEGPGQEEDRQGMPFVGPAGQLLDKMIAAMGFHRDDVYICNVVKCRPPNNRTPLPAEGAACAPFLNGQLEAIAPRVLVALGRCAAENMNLVPAGGGWRGRWGKYLGIDVMATYHPAFLLRSPEFKRPVWEDLQKVMSHLKG
jgi:DNA polymerase